MNNRYDLIDSRLFIENRKRIASRLEPKSVAIFNSNDEFPRNGDAFYSFRQNSDLFWLSGIDQEKSILVLCPDAYKENMREILFVRETNEHLTVWEGYKYSKEDARRVSGIQNVQWLHDFDKVMHELFIRNKNIYINLNENIRADIESDYRDLRMMEELKSKYPVHQYHRLGPIIDEVRSVKHSIEVEIMQHACNITEKAFRRVLGFVKPGVYEYEVEAEIIHEFIRNRANGHAYNPIIASGGSSCILHYNANNSLCQEGDILLMDFGCEYANYASDLSRTIPVSGRFSPRQKDVYNACLNVMKHATSLLKPGTVYLEYEKEVGRFMESELISLGLIDKHDVAKQDPSSPLYKKYFMHGTSHFLGLDVHDVGNRDLPMKAGHVFTCEPGIYIPEENIGIRIENDILLTENGNIDLMASIPREAEEIEELMNT
ncbi:MAG: aminopeptidase P N-terminal domain-containing protein [Flavobacteriales bacterium]|nr:aminopeptidase P N-terminal domain-containing protein [Flavobacteriales bacterium]